MVKERVFFGGPRDGHKTFLREDEVTFCAFGASRAVIYTLRRVRIKIGTRTEIVEAMVPVDDQPAKYQERFIRLAKPDKTGLDFLSGLLGGIFD